MPSTSKARLLARLNSTKSQTVLSRDDQEIYNDYFQRLLGYYENLIDDIYKRQGGSVVFPIGTDILQGYLTGFKINYIPFDNRQMGLQHVEGHWEWDDHDASIINIFYNSNAVSYRQHFTKVHETMHLFQFLDAEFRELLDSLIVQNVLPLSMIEQLMERVADRATATYLMPATQVVQQYNLGKNMLELARDFGVSVQTAMYRLKECGIMMPIN